LGSSQVSFLDCFFVHLKDFLTRRSAGIPRQDYALHLEQDRMGTVALGLQGQRHLAGGFVLTEPLPGNQAVVQRTHG
jgi:hypothetical protein